MDIANNVETYRLWRKDSRFSKRGQLCGGKII